ncbi:ankyrin repeat domain-containing protein [Candidatus Amoebophilus asiaticus]|uniref:ankyrin repeat domain-containing protein n=1 Tax=Candidatus Amoebophilus asiaticus TaxID=281120 RepID=UPI0009FEB2B4|nr:ankyrin repeat domain-containing protein [Candidatus Amoebophilus asiaticus]
MIKLLIACKANVQNTCNGTFLHFTLEEGSIELAELLLDHGANVNAKDNSGRTP